MKKTLCVLLVLVVAVLPLLSCAKEASVQPTSAGVVETPAVEGGEGNTEEQVIYTVPDSNFNGEEFRFLVRTETGLYWNDHDFFAEEENSEPFNDAVYKRNRIVEDKLNVTIAETRITDVVGAARKAVKAGDDVYDVVVTHMQNAGSLASQGMLTNLYEVPYLDLSTSFWDHNFEKSMTMMRKLYFTCGDINTIDNEATWVVFFNKDMAKDMNLENHYNLVNEGRWTVDQLHKYCLETTKDLNGDGVLTPEDQWGAVNQYECMMAMFMGAGLGLTTKDANDLPVLSFNNEKTVSALSRIYEWISDKQAQVKADDYYGKYADVWTEINVYSFVQKRALYYVGPLTSVNQFRAMESNFGILPLPKVDAAQTNYYSPVQYNNGTVITIPVTNVDLERTGIVLQSMAGESVNTVTKAYYDVTLKRKFARDDESAEMLDLVFANRIFDLGFAYNWGGLQAFFESIAKAKTFEFASAYEKIEPKVKKDLEKTIATFGQA